MKYLFLIVLLLSGSTISAASGMIDKVAEAFGMSGICGTRSHNHGDGLDLERMFADTPSQPPSDDESENASFDGKTKEYGAVVVGNQTPERLASLKPGDSVVVVDWSDPFEDGDVTYPSVYVIKHAKGNKYHHIRDTSGEYSPDKVLLPSDPSPVGLPDADNINRMLKLEK